MTNLLTMPGLSPVTTTAAAGERPLTTAQLRVRVAQLERENARLHRRLDDPHFMCQRALALLSHMPGPAI